MRAIRSPEPKRYYIADQLRYRGPMVRLPVVCVVVGLLGCGDNNPQRADGGGSEDGGSDGGSSGTDAGIDSNHVVADARPDSAPIIYPAGALVGVSMSGRVGVLLEDFPVASRDRLATAFGALAQSFWIGRAKQQIRLTNYRLVYREFFSTPNSGRDSLPLTEPDEWTITLGSGGPQRTTVDGHDVLAWDYTMTTTILTSEGSPAATEPNLAQIGGTHTESFVLPVDPTMIFQRTGYACMDEDQFPAESVDEENAWLFYDDACKVENPQTASCHLTFPQPNRSCVRAVREEIGSETIDLVFERLPWSDAIADQVRRGPVTVQDAPDLSVVDTGEQGLSNNRIIYRYFPPGHCALIEQCVGGSGWRRLLAFDAHDHNQGGKPVHIGAIDYSAQGFFSELIDHNVYEFSSCHGHYHFAYFGDFTFGTGVSEVNKQGFCLESTGRLSNNELSPLHHPYGCEFQGIEAGWADLYAAGLSCQWVDVTVVDTASAPVTRNLQFSSNPDGFICEGELQKDSMGNQIWEPTTFVAANGEPVDRPACTQAPGVDANNIKSVPVTLPQKGGMLTQPCTDPQTLGPTRNCGFTAQASLVNCTAGQSVTFSCNGGSAAQPQVVRLCETSRVLGGGIDCVHRDALANTVLEGTATMITTTCPAARGGAEIGGQVAIYTAPVYAPDGASAVTCTVQ